MRKNELERVGRRTGAALPFAMVFAAVIAFAASPAWSFDWPAAGGTATIPAGSLVEVTGADAPLAAACGEIVIESGATLSFTNITANATFAGKISGPGKISAVNAKGTKKTLTFTGDLSEFTGGMDFTYVFATFNTGNSGSAPLKFYEDNADKISVSFTGAYTYLNPIDSYGGANYGITVAAATTLGGNITWRGGRLAGSSDSVVGAGGTVTGNVYCEDCSIYAQKAIRLLGDKLERNASGGTVYADGSPLDLKSKILNFTKLCTYRTTGVVRFLDENLVPDNCVIQFGTASYASGGALDLNGYSQRCKYITHSSGATYYATWKNTSIDSKSGPATFTILAQTALTFPGRFDSHVSLAYESSTANTLTLTALTNATDGAVRVTKGKLAFGADATWPSLSELEVSGTGALTVNNGMINPGHVKVVLADSGALTLSSGVVVTADTVTVDGAYLAPGPYNKDSPALNNHLAGDGELVVLNPEPKAEGGTFVWVGGSDGDALSTAANWKGGEAPAFDGTERLVFGEGTAQAVVSGVVSAYAIDIVTNAAFTLSAADDNAKIVLGAGGLTVTNAAGSTLVTHTVSCPIELYAIPQTWLVATNSAFNNSGPIISHATPNALVVRSFGRVNFQADNSALLAPMIVTNIVPAYSQPIVYNMKGLGSATRQTTIHGCPPRFDTTRAGSHTNETPLRIFSDVTGTLSKGSYINNSNAGSLYLTGGLSYYKGSCETYFSGNVHMLGGVTHEKGSTITWRLAGGNEWIEGAGFNSEGALVIDYDTTLNIAAPTNTWSSLNVYKATIKCHGTNVLARGKMVKMGSNNTAYLSRVSKIDLNGYDQSIGRLLMGWTPSSRPDYYTTVTSVGPAMLEIASETVNNDIVQVRFTGAAGLRFAAPGSITFTNQTASTVGTLQVESGTVRFAATSGWIATTNIVLAGGTIAVAAGAGAKAFGPSQGLSEAWMTQTGGTLEIASGEEATVCALAVPKGNGHFRYLAPGVYGGSSAGLDSAHTLDWMSGGGTLRVLRSGDAGTLIILK